MLTSFFAKLKPMILPEQIPHQGFKNVPANKHIYVSVLDVAKRNRTGKRVDETHSADEDGRDGKAFRARGGLE
jgi:hypothetical protein